jgi:hypothetical protein
MASEFSVNTTTSKSKCLSIGASTFMPKLQRCEDGRRLFDLRNNHDVVSRVWPLEVVDYCKQSEATQM